MRADFGPLPFGRTVGDNRSTLSVSLVLPTCVFNLRVKAVKSMTKDCIRFKVALFCRYPKVKTSPIGTFCKKSKNHPCDYLLAKLRRILK